MPSSNLAVKTDFTATPDTLIQPSTDSQVASANDDSVVTRLLRRRSTLKIRTIVSRDHGLRTFRIR